MEHTTHDVLEGQPLDGIKVLDLGRYYQAPYAGFLLALAGAEVVKIEPIQGEPMRRRAATGGHTSFQQAILNVNKHHVTLDLKHPRGKQLLLELADRADVLVENFAPGVMDKLGVGQEVLARRNPALIYASGTGFGLSGPNRDSLALDIVVQAVTGVAAVTGDPAGAPAKAGPAVADFLGGAHLYGGIATALFQRTRTGRGRLVEVSMQDATYLSLTTNLAAYYYTGDPTAGRTGNRHAAITPYDLYPAKDGFVAIICTTDDQWLRLLSAMGREDLRDDERLATNLSRLAHIELTHEVVVGWTHAHTRDEVFAAAQRFGVAAAPVRDLAEVNADPHMHARGMLRHVEHPELGRIVAPHSPIRYGGTSPMELLPHTQLGMHNSDVYARWLGLDASEIAALEHDRVI
jgi:CoA:oxalate CoA-transferase